MKSCHISMGRGVQVVKQKQHNESLFEVRIVEGGGSYKGTV